MDFNLRQASTGRVRIAADKELPDLNKEGQRTIQSSQDLSRLAGSWKVCFLDYLHRVILRNRMRHLEAGRWHTVWTVTTKPYKGAHFATFPPDLMEPCILAGAPVDGVVLDLFLGSGTTAMVAKKLGRQYLGIELNPEYMKLAHTRITTAQALELDRRAA